MIEHLETVRTLWHTGKSILDAPPNLNPPPAPLDNTKQIDGLLGNAKYYALLSLGAGFFIGLAVFGVGRTIDHHRAGKVGLIMMLACVFGGLFYAIGPSMIVGFAGGQ